MPISRLSIVAFQETRHTFTARCLEHDITAAGRTIEFAVDALLKIVRAHINFDSRHARAPLSAFAPAPRLYWDAFRRGSQHWVFDVLAEQSGTPGARTHVDVALVAQHPAVRPPLAVPPGLAAARPASAIRIA
jgi:hypothetical protein